jgi:hypothetical protein
MLICEDLAAWGFRKKEFKNGLPLSPTKVQSVIALIVED